jgi:catalase
MWAMSDRTLPRSFRMMEGFGVHTFKLVNASGKASFVKFHWKPRLGLQSTIWDEALKLQSADNDYQRRDLFEAIDAAHFRSGTLASRSSTRPSRMRSPMMCSTRPS